MLDDFLNSLSVEFVSVVSNKGQGRKGNHSCEVQELKGRMKNTSILESTLTSSCVAFCHLNKIKCFSKFLN